MQIADFIVENSQCSKDKKNSRENNTKVPEVWENFAQARISGKFCAIDEIMHKSYHSVQNVRTAGNIKANNYYYQTH